MLYINSTSLSSPSYKACSSMDRVRTDSLDIVITSFPINTFIVPSSNRERRSLPVLSNSSTAFLYSFLHPFAGILILTGHILPITLCHVPLRPPTKTTTRAIRAQAANTPTPSDPFVICTHHVPYSIPNKNCRQGKTVGLLGIPAACRPRRKASYRTTVRAQGIFLPFSREV